jgi:hypothetical protein
VIRIVSKILICGLFGGAPICFGAEPEVPMSKSYEAPVEKVFGAMVQASSSHDIKLVSKDGCLVKFAAAMPGTAAGAIGTLLGGGAEAVITVDFTAYNGESFRNHEVRRPR